MTKLIPTPREISGPAVGHMMTTKVATLERDDTLDIADGIMTMGRLRHLPVLHQGRLVGVVSQRDLFRSALAASIGLGRAQSKMLKSVRVGDVMSEPPVTIEPEAAVAEAARVMLERKIGCLPVVTDGELVGIVTESDLLERLARS